MSGNGYIYVIAFSNGTVKVGKTKNTAQRMYAHRADARNFGLTITDEWTSPLHAEWEDNERKLKYFGSGLADVPMGREYFNNISYASVMDRVADLTFTPPPARQADEGAPPIPAHVPLRALRKSLGLTSPALADRLKVRDVKVDPDHILAVELGHRRAGTALRVAWADELRINPSDIHMAAELREIVAAADSADAESDVAA